MSVSLGGASPLGSCGYVLGSIELASQLRQINLQADVLVVAQGSSGTHAGLLVGQRWLDASYEVMGVSVSRSTTECAQRVAMIASEVCQLLKIDFTLSVDDIWVNEDYIGEGYGIPTDAAFEAIKMVAQYEGIFLDPIYTGKAMAGLIDQIRQGHLKKGQTVIFLHTGGWPALFA